MTESETADLKEDLRSYYQKNREKLAAYRREYYNTNRSKIATQTSARCSGYMNGKLDPTSAVGKNIISIIIVAEALGLDNDALSNCAVKFNFDFDIYDANKYHKIDVKSAKLDGGEHWKFSLHRKHPPDHYIFVAYSSDNNRIERVWIIPTDADILRSKKMLSVRNATYSLEQIQEFEVDHRIYNNCLQNMSIDDCYVFAKPEITNDVL